MLIALVACASVKCLVLLLSNNLTALVSIILCASAFGIDLYILTFSMALQLPVVTDSKLQGLPLARSVFNPPLVIRFFCLPLDIWYIKDDSSSPLSSVSSSMYTGKLWYNSHLFILEFLVSASPRTSDSGLPHTDAPTNIAVVLPSPLSLLCTWKAAQGIGDNAIRGDPNPVPTMYWCISNPSRS